MYKTLKRTKRTKRTKHKEMSMTLTTSYEDLPPLVQREWWCEKTLIAAFKNDKPHRELTTVRHTYNGPMNGYEYTLRTSICHSRRAGNIVKYAGWQLSDVVPFHRLKYINKECLYVFL